MDAETIAQAYVNTLRDHTFNPPTDFEPHTLTLPQAYAVQDRALALREARGEALAGYKVGCTSAAIQSQFGLSEPISARLFGSELHVDGARLAWADYVDLAVEPEFAIRIGEGGTLESITAAIEIHNYRFWSGKPSSQELVMSNGIHAGLVMGKQRVAPDEIDLDGARVELRINGKSKAAGFGRDIMQGPLSSLSWLKAHLAARGFTLKPGHLVIPGSPVPLVTVPRGAEVEARIDGLGTARAMFA